MAEDFDTTSDVQEDELESLKARAMQLGIKHHPSIGLDKLREKVNAAAKGEPAPVEEDVEWRAVTEPTVQSVPAPVEETKQQKSVRLKNEANELIRVNISCMNPNKSEWDGEIFTGGNSVVGSFRKYVPFNVDWHVPRVLVNMLEQRKAQIFFTHTDHRGNKSRRGRLAKEFAVSYLDPLSVDEIHDLAQRQAMANGTQAA